MTDTGTVTITITPVDDNDQVVATNTGLTVNEGDTGTVITQAMLETTDADNTPVLLYTSDAADALTVVVVVCLGRSDTNAKVALADGLLRVVVGDMSSPSS